jgi:hypothetical protein
MMVSIHEQKNLHTELTRNQNQNPLNESQVLHPKTTSSPDFENGVNLCTEKSARKFDQELEQRVWHQTLRVENLKRMCLYF